MNNAIAWINERLQKDGFDMTNLNPSYAEDHGGWKCSVTIPAYVLGSMTDKAFRGNGSSKNAALNNACQLAGRAVFTEDSAGVPRDVPHELSAQ